MNNSVNIGKKMDPIVKALLIGIDYKIFNVSVCKYINNINMIKKYIKKNLDAEKKNVQILTNESEIIPTKYNIFKSFDELASNLKIDKKYKIIIYYSGSGKLVNNYLNFKGNSDVFIIPYDYQQNGIITKKDFYSRFIKKVQKNSNLQINILLDCCYSNNGFVLKYNYTIDDIKSLYNGKYTVTYYKTEKNFNATVIILSGYNNLNSNNTFLYKYSCNLTKFLIQLCESYNSSQNKITLYKIFSRLRTLLNSGHYYQIPKISSNKYINLKNVHNFL